MPSPTNVTPPPKNSSGRLNLLFGIAKMAVAGAILAYLFYQAKQDASFDTLRSQPKNWVLLVGAFLVAITAISLTMVRWYLLVRALDLKFALHDAFRLGFIGYLCNFLTLGIVGGDVMKAIFIARSQKGRRAEAVATVFVDRAIGLYALFVMASVAFLFVDIDPERVRNADKLAAVQKMIMVTVAFSIAGLLGLLLLLSPLAPRIRKRIKRLPKLGPLLGRLMAAVLIYRAKLRILLVAFLMSMVTHAMFCVCIFMIAVGLPGQHLELTTHFAIVPIANVAGSLPLPGGLGAFEYALNFLYGAVSPQESSASQGFIIALAYRLITILIALVGLVFYRSSREEMKDIAREAEQGA